MSYRLLSTVSLICLMTVTTALAGEPLSPRVEVSAKGGNKRSILSTQIWAPLAQRDDRVLYADLRLMGDNDENREGNFGLGYREINPYTNTVIGFHGWYDQRRTENDSTFRQLTFGVDSLGHVWDVRANGYIPLNKSRTTGSGTASDPYLAGTGIYYDINGLLVETPQYGVDGEIGYRIPVLQKQADTIRVYGGGYHFFRDGTDNVTGFRIRTEATINSAFSLGARYQYDEPRGSQGFLEATIRFPFGAKKLYQTEGLRSRLDESAERDVDIVTSASVTPGQKGVAVVNEAGTQQRILYVDNEATSGGDGSKDNPFNTLADAQAALLDHDILYIDHGDGTTTGMDQGIIIDKANISLIGSGSDLSYAGHTLIAAGLAPVITNMQTNGHAIYASGDDFLVSGLTIDGAQQRYGILFNVLDGQEYNSVTIINNTIVSNTNRGIGILPQTNTNGILNNILIADNTINTLNNQRAIFIGGYNAAANNSSMEVGKAYILDNHIQSGNIYHANDLVIHDLRIQHNLLESGNIGISTDGATANSKTDITADISNNIVHSQRWAALDINFVKNGKVNARLYDNEFVSSLPVSGTPVDPHAVMIRESLGNPTAADGRINLSFYNNVIANNGSTGTAIYVAQYGGLGQMNIDFGGGILDSIGQNSITTSGALPLARIEGAYIPIAQYNWWGSAAGLLPANLHPLSNGTIDAANPLAQDPDL